MTSKQFFDEIIETCRAIVIILQSSLTNIEEIAKENDEEHLWSSDLDEQCLFAPSDKISVIFTDIAKKIEDLIKQLHDSPSFVTTEYDYFLDFLYHFNFIHDRFTEAFTMTSLSNFELNLMIFIQSLEAYQGAQNGNIDIVEKFLEKDPSSKNRPLLNGHTLLYVATMNQRLEMIKYLIEKEKCSVNALNQNDTIPAMDTALHIACYKGYANITDYLLSQSANCYIKNKKEETATMIANTSSSLYTVFLKHLVLDYTRKVSSKINLPIMTIADELSSINYDTNALSNNCIWEFKLLHQQNWQVFLEKESSDLTTNLRVKSDIKIDLNVQERIWTISMMKFLKEDNSSNANENQAWIRCRGSSIYNFDVISRWQLMLIICPTVTDNKYQAPQLRTMPIPSVFNRDRFEYHLNSWYNADEMISKSIDEAINQRLRCLTINTRFLGVLRFNLEFFSFASEDNTIQGFVRWIPKFVNVDVKTKQIRLVDDFQAIELQNNPPVPLRNKMLREYSTLHKQITDQNDILDENNDSSANENLGVDPPDNLSDHDNEQEEKQDDVLLRSELTELDIDVVCDNADDSSLVEIEENNSTKFETIRNNIQEKRDELNRETAQARQYEKIVEQEQNALAKIKEKQNEDEPKMTLISKLCEGVSNPPQSEEFTSLQQEYENQEKILKSRMDELNDIKKRCDQLELELNIEQNKVQLFENRQQQELQASNELITKQYELPGSEYVQLQSAMVEDYLRTLSYPDKTKFHEAKIKIHVEIHQTKEHYHLWTVDCYLVHHIEMNAVRSRTEQIIRQVIQQKKIYRTKLIKITHEFIKEIAKIPFKCSAKNWKLFLKIFQDLINDKLEDFCRQFNTEIGKKAKQLINNMVQNIPGWWKELAKETSNYVATHDFMNSIKNLKRTAFQQFIRKGKEHIEFPNEYNKKSIDARGNLS